MIIGLIIYSEITKDTIVPIKTPGIPIILTRIKDKLKLIITSKIAHLLVSLKSPAAVVKEIRGVLIM